MRHFHSSKAYPKLVRVMSVKSTVERERERKYGLRRSLSKSAAERRLEKFIDAAREFGCEDRGVRFEKAFARVVDSKRLGGQNKCKT
jgi:hypothetical protein